MRGGQVPLDIGLLDVKFLGIENKLSKKLKESYQLLRFRVTYLIANIPRCFCERDIKNNKAFQVAVTGL